MALDNNQIENSNIDNDEISLKEIVVIIKEWVAFLKFKWKFIFIASLLGGCIALGLVYNEKPYYTAVLTFAMEEDKGGGSLGGAAGIASTLGIDLGGGGSGGAFAVSNLAELMKSRLIVEKVLLNTYVQKENKQISLAEYYIQINKLRKGWEANPVLRRIEFLPGADPSKFTIEEDSVLQEIYRNLIDKEKLVIMPKDKKVSILAISVKSHDEIFSKLFCENLAEEVSDFYIKTKSKKSRNNVEILQKQVDSVKNELNGAITGMGFEVDNVYNLNPAFNVKTGPSKRKQIDIQANTAIITNLIVQLELAKINLRKETPLIQLIDRPILPLEKEKISKIKWIFIGGIIPGVLSILTLILGKIIKKQLS